MHRWVTVCNALRLAGATDGIVNLWCASYTKASSCLRNLPSMKVHFQSYPYSIAHSFEHPNCPFTPGQTSPPHNLLDARCFQLLMSSQSSQGDSQWHRFAGPCSSAHTRCPTHSSIGSNPKACLDAQRVLRDLRNLSSPSGTLNINGGQERVRLGKRSGPEPLVEELMAVAPTVAAGNRARGTTSLAVDPSGDAADALRRTPCRQCGAGSWKPRELLPRDRKPSPESTQRRPFHYWRQ
jgi:hypothetical protein